MLGHGFRPLLHTSVDRSIVFLLFSLLKRTIVQTHNLKVLCNAHASSEIPCNCRIKDQCPVQGACQKPVVYKAPIKVDRKYKIYISSTNNFIARYSVHKNSFKSEINKNTTALSTLVWSKGLNPCPSINLEIIRVVPPYKP